MKMGHSKQLSLNPKGLFQREVIGEGDPEKKDYIRGIGPETYGLAEKADVKITRVFLEIRGSLSVRGRG